MRKQKINFWSVSKYSLSAALLFGLLLPLSSCYSYQLTSFNTVGEPDPFSEREDHLKGLKVHEVNTTLKVGATVDLPMIREDCGELGFHTIVIKHTFGGILLSAVTFGRHRKIKVKYVCVKPQN